MYKNVKHDYTISKEAKFELVSCSVKGVHCKNVLPIINELYAKAELARIDKEYQKSAEFLQIAYAKTKALKEPVCVQCVNCFQSSITETLDNLQVEVHSMSVGFFHKKRYEHVYEKLSNFVRKMKLNPAIS